MQADQCCSYLDVCHPVRYTVHEVPHHGTVVQAGRCAVNVWFFLFFLFFLTNIILYYLLHVIYDPFFYWGGSPFLD